MLGAVREDAIFTRLFAGHWATLSWFLDLYMHNNACFRSSLGRNRKNRHFVSGST
jgi:hypothetical protein